MYGQSQEGFCLCTGACNRLGYCPVVDGQPNGIAPDSGSEIQIDTEPNEYDIDLSDELASDYVSEGDEVWLRVEGDRIRHEIVVRVEGCVFGTHGGEWNHGNARSWWDINQVDIVEISES